MRKWAFLVLLVAAIWRMNAPIANAQAVEGVAPALRAEQTPTMKENPPAKAVGTRPADQSRITGYTLPPERDKKARALSKIYRRMLPVNLVYGIVMLLLILRWKLGAKFRDMAEKASSKRFVQALIFVPLIELTLGVLSLPRSIYGNWIERVYGLSVQGWASWFWDWTKRELIGMVLGMVVVWILYSVIRKSPTRWWVYFWLTSLPLIVLMIFLQPLVIDPMFHKFEPLRTKDPALTAELEKMVKHAGQDIPAERILWMGAGEKTTELNAYVTGWGASKRIVVWDTTIAKMTTPQIVYVAGHEMGHYVLNHIVKGFAFAAAGLLAVFYLGHRIIGWVLAKWGAKWGIRELGDWASYPALLLLLAMIGTLAGPIGNSFSRYQEHQADQYGLEVTHELTADSGQVAAQAFNVLGDVDLADPEPSRWLVFLFYSHPAIPDRIQFSLHYDPWVKGGTGELVK